MLYAFSILNNFHSIFCIGLRYCICATGYISKITKTCTGETLS